MGVPLDENQTRHVSTEMRPRNHGKLRRMTDAVQSTEASGSPSAEKIFATGTGSQFRESDRGLVLAARPLIELESLKLAMEEFQSFFGRLMRLAHPHDYQPTSKAGPLGDRGVDGYLASMETVFQVYAPTKAASVPELNKKIVTNFDQARSCGLKIRRWVFVYCKSHDRHTDTLALLQKLHEDTGVEVELWGFDEIWREVARIPSEAVLDLIPAYRHHLAIAVRRDDATTPRDFNNRVHLAQGTGGSSSAAEHLLREMVISKDYENCDLRDREAARTLDAVRSHFAALSIPAAVAMAPQLTAIVDDHQARRISPQTCGRAMLLLADIAMAQAIDESEKSQAHLMDARAWISRAQTAFGAEISEEDAERIICSRAKLQSFSGEAEAALTTLASMDRPRAIALRLAMLFELKRLDEATNLASGRELHASWAEFAILVAVEARDYQRAWSIVDWAVAQCDDLTRRRFLMRCCSQIVAQYESDLAFRSLAFDSSRAAAAAMRLADVVKRTAPLVDLVLNKLRQPDGIDVESVAIAAAAAHRLGDTSRERECYEFLSSVDPIPLSYARAVGAGFAESIPDLAGKLRSQYPASHDAAELAIMIEAAQSAGPQAAIRLLQAVVEHSDAARRRQVCELLFEYASVSGPDDQATVTELIEAQLGPNDRLSIYARATTLIRSGDAVAAQVALQAITGHPDTVWWQLMAQCQFLTGDLEDAAESMRKAVSLMPRAETIRAAVGFAERANRWDVAEEMLKALIASNPSDGAARSRLGEILAEQHRFREASQEFENLCKSRPEEPTFALNYCICLRGTGEHDAAANVLDGLLQSEKADLRAVLLRAELYRERQEPARALRLLRAREHLFWDNQEFLLCFVSAGFACGDEIEAHRALEQLWLLKQKGAVPDSTIRSVTVEEMLGVLRSRAETMEKMVGLTIRGHAPWIALDAARGLPAAAAWGERTNQSTPPGDTVSIRALRSIYATNHFTPQRLATGRHWLVEIAAPPPGSPIIVDLSALITLSELGLIDHAVRYFGELLVPAGYIPYLLAQAPRLRQLQVSQLRAAHDVLAALAKGELCVEAGKNGGDPLPCVDEYSPESDDASPRYGLRDLLDLLKSRGLLSNAEHTRIAAGVTARAHRIPPLANALERGIRVTTQTLMAIACNGLLPAAISATRIIIDTSTERAFQSIIAQAQDEEKAASCNNSVLERLVSDTKIRKVERSMADRSEGTVDVEAINASFWACELATERRTPLMVDDRSLQMIALQNAESSPSGGFGTPALVSALLSEGQLSFDEATAAFQRLIEWRYRFLIPPVSVLVHMMRQWQADVPTVPLLRMARYVHDCMRDAGLFAGREQTSPPISIAMHFCQQWTIAIVRALVSIWVDESFDEPRAATITAWVLSRMIPGPAITLVPSVEASVAEHVRLSTIGMAIAAAPPLPPSITPRIARLLGGACEIMGVSDPEYFKLVVRLIQMVESDGE